MQPMLNLAVKAARRAGDVIFRNLNRVQNLEVRPKGKNDFVSEVDHLAEQEIISTIRQSYPNHGFLAEESGRSGDDEYQWIIDPLDGTTNFLHGFPQFAVSMALQRRGRIEHGVVYDPLRQELFTASRGDGAQLDGRRIRVSRQVGLEGSLIGTGFPYRENSQWLEEYINMFRAVTQNTRGLPSCGCRRARPGLRRCRPPRRLLGDGPVPVGHGGRHVADHGSRRTDRHVDGRRIQPGWPHHRRHAEGVSGRWWTC